jgi:hypothetical protein
MAGNDRSKIEEFLYLNFADPICREAMILVTVLQGVRGQAESMLEALCDRDGIFDEQSTSFIKDCIHRGLILDDRFLDKLFRSFSIHALNDQKSFGSCASLLSSDYGMFWHLLRLQRIPQAREAINYVVRNAEPGSLVSGWPTNERAKTFAPTNLYGGPLATLEPGATILTDPGGKHVSVSR